MRRLVKYADELVTSIGQRPGGSEGEHEAARLIAGNLEDFGLDTWMQEFPTARNSGWVRIIYYLLGVLAAAVLFFVPTMTLLALALAVLAAVLLILDLLGKNPLYNLFKTGLSQNVIARYIPEGADPRRKIVVVAHYDSGRNMLQCAPPLVPFYTLIRKAIRICVVALAVLIVLSLLPFPEIVGFILSIIGLLVGAVLLIAMIIEIINLFMPYSMGANSNASGVAAMMGVAGELAGMRENISADRDTRAHPEDRVLQERTGRHGRVRGGAGASHEIAERNYYPEHAAQGEYNEAAPIRSPRRQSASGKTSAGVGGAAGSLVSGIRGLFSRKASGGGRRDASSDFEQTYEDYVDPPEKTRIRSGVPTPREDTLSAKKERMQTQIGSPSPYGNEPGAQTADLGAQVSAATKAAAGGSELQGGLKLHRTSQRESLSPNVRLAARSRIETGATENPAIRVRETVAEREEQERILRDKAEEVSRAASGRTEDGTPAWFAEAKKAAKKDSDSDKEREDASKVTRSRYADVPVELEHEEKEAPNTSRSALSNSPQPTSAPSRKGGSNRPAMTGEGQFRESSAATSAADGGAAGVAISGAYEGGYEDTYEDVYERERQNELDQTHAMRQSRPERGYEPGTAQEFTPQREQRSASSSEPPTMFDADFSGIDRLASDPMPSTSRRSRLPQGASQLEYAASTPPPEIPANERLRNLPKPLVSNSGVIPKQQAAFDQQVSLPEEEETSEKRVSNTGSFAPLGATGVMKPVGEELLRYYENEQDIYIEDADESGNWNSNTRSSRQSNRMMDIPKSRTRSFFGNLGDRLSGSRKEENLDSSPSSWLGVEKDFDARSEGSQIGGWENFSEEDDETWKGGAYGGDSYEENAQALTNLNSLLIDKEVWIVAAGSHENKNAGIKNLLSEYERELKSALIINIDGVGRGNLFYTVAEGSFLPKGTDHRLQNLIKSAAHSLGVKISPTGFAGYTTEAAEAMAQGARSISLLGLDGKMPSGWRWDDDDLSILDEGNLNDIADVVIEVIKSV